MRQHRGAAGTAVVALLLSILAVVPARAAPGDERILVHLRAGSAEAVAAAAGGRVERRILPGTWRLRASTGALRRLEADPRVEWAEVDRKVRLAAVPNDPCFAPPSTNQCGRVDQWGLSRVGAPVAWDFTTGSADVVVAVLDTGVHAAHADLAGKVVVGSNFSDSPFSDDRHGHGTHVAGIVAAATDNGEGIAGTGWNTKVRSIKVLDDDGGGWDSDIALGINEAVVTGASVVNMSFADTGNSRTVRQAVDAAVAAGLVLVAAAGNFDPDHPMPLTTRHYPAAHDGVIGVAASMPDDSLAPFSFRGNWVSLSAPGVGIVSTVPNNNYAVFDGTSMASGFVAGAAALLFAADRTATAHQVRARLGAGAAVVAGTGTEVAWGRLDIAAALRGTAPGYWLVASDGGIFNYGSARFFGSAGGTPLPAPVVGMAATPTRRGYWLATADGDVLPFGDARSRGSMKGMRLNAPMLAMEATPSGSGYWLVGGDGGIFSFGDATFHGSTGGMRLNQPVVGMATTPNGRGYWLVASDGGIFAFGNAGFAGSMGGRPLNQPVVAMAPTATGRGYWLVASDGGIFAFGDAGFHGSMGGLPLNRPIVGMRPTPTGRGYWLVASDGGIFAFGDAPFLGSTGGIRLNQPVVGMAS